MTDDPSLAPDKRSRRPVIAAVAVVLVVLVVLVAVAIFATASRDGKATPTTQAPTTATTLSAIDTKVLGDYRAFWDAYLTAANPMRPDHPILQQHATGEELKTLVSAFSAAKAGNEIYRGTYETNARVLNVSGTTATVRDCYFDHSGAYDATTGERKDKEDVERQLVEVQMQLEGDTWKVASIAGKGTGCVAP